MQYLTRAAGEVAEMDDGAGAEAGAELGRILGHLPLALTTAAHYMRRCDVTVKEYLALIEGRRGTTSHWEPVLSSLSLTLERIDSESRLTRR